MSLTHAHGGVGGEGQKALSARATCGIALPARMAAGMALSGIVLLFAMIIIFAVPAFMQVSVNASGGASGVFSWSWRPYQGEFGILPMICGSLILSASALLLAWPLALCVCCWLLTSQPYAEHGGTAKNGRNTTRGQSSLRRSLQGRMHACVRHCIHVMAAIPTVVYGFAAVFLITPLVRAGLGGSGFCWLAAAVMLALLVLPTMVLVLESSLTPRLEKLCPAGLATGLTRLELLYYFVLPQSRKALLAAALLGVGRAMGDTLLPLMLAGNAPLVPGGPAEGLRTLTAHMALVTANEVGGAAYNSLFAAGAILLAVSALTSLALRRLQQNGEKAEEQRA